MYASWCLVQKCVPFVAEHDFIVGKYHNLFIYSSTDGHLDHFQCGVILTKATMNICAQTLCDMYFHFSAVNS